MKKSDRDPATVTLHMIKNRQQTDVCPTRACCVDLWGGEEVFSSIRDLTKFELIYRQDEFICKSGDPATSLYVIQSGAVKLEKEVDCGGNHVSGFYFAGDIIGLESVDIEQYYYDAIALKDTWICEIRLKKLATQGESAASIRQRVGTLLGRKLREMDRHLCCTRYLHTEQRLLDFLYMLSEKNLEYTDDSLKRFVLPMAKTDIANYLGMRPESLSRAFRQLENRGIAENHSKRKSTIIDKQKLLSEVIKLTA